MVDLYVSADFGGSSTKIIYQHSSWSHPQHLFMSPLIEETSSQKLNQYWERKSWVGTIGEPLPEQEAWLEWQEQTIVVGEFTKEFLPDPDQIFELKYESAVWKLVAALGIIVQKHSLKSPSKKKLSVAVGALLPYDEYTDRKIFSEFVSKVLKNYRFRGQTLRFEAQVYCRPEGGGLLAWYVMHKGIDYIRQRRLGVLMLGHRNATLIRFENGELKDGDSPKIGFYADMLQRVCQLKSGLDEDSLATALFRALREQVTRRSSHKDYSSYEEPTFYRSEFPRWRSLKAIQALATAKTPELQAQEVANTETAIQTAIEEYWQKVAKWLNKKLPRRFDELDEVLVSGGSAYFCEPQLEEYFNCQPEGPFSIDKYQPRNKREDFVPLIWSEPLIHKARRTFDPCTEQTSEQMLALRMVDVHGFFEYVVDKAQTQKSKSSGSSPSKASKQQKTEAVLKQGGQDG